MFHNRCYYTLRVTSNPALSSIANCTALNKPTKFDGPNDFQSLNAYI